MKMPAASVTKPIRRGDSMKWRRSTAHVIFLTIGWLAAVTSGVQSGLAETADVILHHGKVATVDAKFTLCEAIALRGERILRVGSNDEVLALRGEKTQV